MRKRALFSFAFLLVILSACGSTAESASTTREEASPLTLEEYHREIAPVLSHIEEGSNMAKGLFTEYGQDPTVAKSTEWQASAEQVVSMFREASARADAIVAPVELTPVHDNIKRAASIFAASLANIVDGIRAGDDFKVENGAESIARGDEILREALLELEN